MLMKPFLYQVAKTIYNAVGDDIGRMAFVFPNRRSGKFFQRYVKEIAGHPIFSPTIFTINNLITHLSGLQPIDKIDLLFTIYKEYIALRRSDETFDKFVFWGEMLAGDFDDVDKYMVEADKLFTNIKDLKDLDQLYLTPEQKAIIAQFWESYLQLSDGVKREEFNNLWSIMYELYTRVRARLLEQGVGYEGMIFRQVATLAQQGKLPEMPYDKVVFVGFNAMTTSERIILKHFRDTERNHSLKGYDNNSQGDFYWDYYAPTMCYDKEGSAAYFMEQNIAMFPSQLTLSENHPITTAPEMTVISVSSAVGQVKHAGSILKQLVDEGKIRVDEAINTAVVLPDEELLIPMIYSIPQEIEEINITMGYPLRNTSIATLFEAVFRLQRRIRFRNGEPLFYHEEVAAILNHRIVRSIVKYEKVEELVEQMNKLNMSYVQADYLAQHKLLELIFTSVTNLQDALKYLERLLNYLLENLSDEDSEEHDSVWGMSHIEYEYTYHYSLVVSRLNDVIEAQGVDMKIETYFSLLGKMSLSIPFEGEPLAGLQLMGVLETRALDFDNIIILSMNDGVFPMKKVANSFIPYNLRCGFEMATSEHQDSIYAYYFYRLISRAKRVYMLYDTRTEGVMRSEMSRFVYQLKYHYANIIPGYQINEIAVSHSVSVESERPIVVKKQGHVLERLQEYLAGGEGKKRRLSASSIKTYINCPLQFYLKHVEDVHPDNEINEMVDSSVFGTIYHNVMADIYDEMKNGNESVNVTERMIDAVMNDSEKLMSKIVEQFNIVFYRRKKGEKLLPVKGKNEIVARIVEAYVKQTLEWDKSHAPFLYIDSEKRLQDGLYITLDEEKKVLFKALIDRVDLKDNKVRIIDYKTGGDEMSVPSVDAMFIHNGKKNYDAIFQVLLYCHLYRLQFPDDMRELQPLIYKVRNAYSNLAPLLTCAREPIESYSGDLQREYEELLHATLREIFDEETDFVQTQEHENCKYCDFKIICKR